MMIHTIDADKLAFLKTTVTQWEEQNLLTHEQSQQLLAIYRKPDKREKGMAILLTAAVLLSGKILIDLIGKNQIDLSNKYYVLLALLISMPALFYFGWKTISVHSTRYVGESLLLVGGILYAAGIALATQMFNWTSDINLECAAFMVGIAGLAVLCRSHALTILSACGGVVFCAAHDVPCVYRYLAIATMLVVAYAARSRWAVAITLGLIVCLAQFSPPNESVKTEDASTTFDYVRFCLIGCALFSLYHRHSESPGLKLLAPPYLMASLFVFASLLMQSSSGIHDFEHASVSASSLGIYLLGFLTCIGPMKKLSCVSICSLLAMTLIVMQTAISSYMPVSEITSISAAAVGCIAAYCAVFSDKFLHLSALTGMVALFAAMYSSQNSSILNPFLMPILLVLLSIIAVFFLHRKLQRTSSNQYPHALNQTSKGF